MLATDCCRGGRRGGSIAYCLEKPLGSTGSIRNDSNRDGMRVCSDNFTRILYDENIVLGISCSILGEPGSSECYSNVCHGKQDQEGSKEDEESLGEQKLLLHL